MTSDPNPFPKMKVVSMHGFQKYYVALLGAFGTWGYTAFADGHLTVAESFGLIVGLSAALGVKQVKNK